MKKIILSSFLFLNIFTYADTYNCDSNCLNGTNMTQNNNSTTGTQMTTSNGFSYFTGTTCNGTNLVNNFSNGSQTIKEANSTTCGYVSAPVDTVSYSDNSGLNMFYFDPNTGLFGNYAQMQSGTGFTADQANQYIQSTQYFDCHAYGAC